MLYDEPTHNEEREKKMWEQLLREKIMHQTERSKTNIINIPCYMIEIPAVIGYRKHVSQINTPRLACIPRAHHHHVTGLFTSSADPAMTSLPSPVTDTPLGFLPFSSSFELEFSS